MSFTLKIERESGERGRGKEEVWKLILKKKKKVRRVIIK
jgi:hypothetical protein